MSARHGAERTCCTPAARNVVALLEDRVVLHPLGIPSGSQRDREGRLRALPAETADRTVASSGFTPIIWKPSPRLHRPAERGFGPAPDPDRDVVRRLRQEANIGEGVVLAGEVVGRVVAPARVEQVDDLVGPAAAVMEVRSQRHELTFRPTHARADGQSAPADGVEARQSVREPQWVVLRKHQHTRAEADAPGHRRRVRERHEWVVEIRRRVPLIGGYHDMVAHPDVVETELLGMARRALHRFGRRGASVLREVDADAQRRQRRAGGGAGEDRTLPRASRTSASDAPGAMHREEE